jgi:copper chaperone CopZ
MTIKNALTELEGIDDVSAKVETKNVIVDYSEPANEQIIIETLKSIGYPPEK